MFCLFLMPVGIAVFCLPGQKRFYALTCCLGHGQIQLLHWKLNEKQFGHVNSVHMSITEHNLCRIVGCAQSLKLSSEKGIRWFTVGKKEELAVYDLYEGPTT